MDRKTFDFSVPQRQSASGILITAANNGRDLVKALFVPLLVFLFKTPQKHLLYSLLILGVFTVLVFVYSFLSYRRFTFFIDKKAQIFIVQKGVFTRSILTIKLENIQQVNIDQSLIQKIIHVYSLSIDTPGGEGNEVKINSISAELALALKENLLKYNEVRKHLDDEKATDQEDENFSISNLTLLKVGLTSNYLGTLLLMLGFLWGIFHNIKDLLREFDKDNGQVENLIESGFNMLSIGLITMILLSVLILANVIRTFIKYYDYRIFRKKNSLLLSYRLFSSKNSLIVPEKVQMVSFTQNYFQRKFNFVNLLLQQHNGGSATDSKDLEKSFISIPGFSESEKEELIKFIFGEQPKKESVYKPNLRYINLPIIAGLVFPLLLFGILTNFYEGLIHFYPISIVYGLMIIFGTIFSYRRHRLWIGEHHIVKISGIWDVSTQLIEKSKIQSISVFQYPWHRSADVGHLEIHTAVGTINFRYGNYTEIKELANILLFEVEVSKENWL